MIRLIRGIERESFKTEIEAMHRNRATVFADRLGWDVSVENGMEIDQFDFVNPLYVVSIDPDSGQYRGSTRLLPTTGPNMLRDVFSRLLFEEDQIASSTIWEGTRFAIDPERERERSRNRLNITTGELLCGAFEVGLIAGLTHIVAVYDARMARVFDRADCRAEIIGRPQRIGKVMTYAGFFEVSEAMLDRVRFAAGITHSVLETETLEPLAALYAA